MDIYEKIKRGGDNAFERAMRMYGIKPKEAEKIFKSTDWANVDNGGGIEGGGSGGGELEGEYYLAKPNGRYWKHKLARFISNREYPHLEGSYMTEEELSMLSEFIDTVLTFTSYSGFVDTDGIPNYPSDVFFDSPISFTMKIAAVVMELSYTGNSSIMSFPSAFAEGGGQIYGIQYSGIIDLLRITMPDDVVMTDDELLAMVSEVFMWEQVTKEEYESWHNW